jgi:YebC/PmpR family DNA-binding regulatory protein
MSGHSKWHNIQGRKGKQDALRSNQFTKLAKAITIAAQHGGDPAANFSLRLAIDRAKAGGMPKDNIDRAIKRGTGELKEGNQIEEGLYESFGPGGVAIIIKVITDNKNRTLPELKKILSNYDGSIGGVGSVQWMFEQLGIIIINNEQLTNNNINHENFELELIEGGAEDIAEQGDETEIKTKIENFQKVLGKLKEFNIEPLRSGIEWVAKDSVKISEDVQGKLEKLFNALEEHDDVEDYYTNA